MPHPKQKSGCATENNIGEDVGLKRFNVYFYFPVFYV